MSKGYLGMKCLIEKTCNNCRYLGQHHPETDSYKSQSINLFLCGEDNQTLIAKTLQRDQEITSMRYQLVRNFLANEHIRHPLLTAYKLAVEEGLIPEQATSDFNDTETVG